MKWSATGILRIPLSTGPKLVTPKVPHGCDTLHLIDQRVFCQILCLLSRSNPALHHQWRRVHAMRFLDHFGHQSQPRFCANSRWSLRMNSSTFLWGQSRVRTAKRPIWSRHPTLFLGARIDGKFKERYVRTKWITQALPAPRHPSPYGISPMAR